MKKISILTILILLVFHSFLFAQDKLRIRPVRTPEGGSFEIVETARDTSALFDMFYEGSMQVVILSTSTNPNIKFELQASYFSIDTTFNTVQTVMTTDTTDSGYIEIKELFSPTARWGRFIGIGQSDNDTARFKIITGQWTNQEAGERSM